MSQTAPRPASQASPSFVSTGDLILSFSSLMLIDTCHRLASFETVANPSKHTAQHGLS